MRLYCKPKRPVNFFNSKRIFQGDFCKESASTDKFSAFPHTILHHFHFMLFSAEELLCYMAHAGTVISNTMHQDVVILLVPSMSSIAADDCMTFKFKRNC